MAPLTGRRRRATLARVFALALLFAGALFVVGVGLERTSHHAGSESPAVTHQESGDAHDESGNGHDESAESEEGAAGHEEGESKEELLGVNLESTPIVALAVVASIAFAAAGWWRPVAVALALGATFALVSALLDIHEVARQIGEDQAGIAAVAGLVALAHLVAAAAAGAALRTRP